MIAFNIQMGFNLFRSRKIQKKISEGESTGFDLFNYVLNTYLITSGMKHKRQKLFYKSVIDKPFSKAQTLKFIYPKHKQL